MKKYIKLYALLAMALFVGACDDELNIVKMSNWRVNNEINLTNDKNKQKFIDNLEAMDNLCFSPKTEKNIQGIKIVLAI